MYAMGADSSIRIISMACLSLKLAIFQQNLSLNFARPASCLTCPHVVPTFADQPARTGNSQPPRSPHGIQSSCAADTDQSLLQYDLPDHTFGPHNYTSGSDMLVRDNTRYLWRLRFSVRRQTKYRRERTIQGKNGATKRKSEDQSKLLNEKTRTNIKNQSDKTKKRRENQRTVKCRLVARPSNRSAKLKAVWDGFA